MAVNGTIDNYYVEPCTCNYCESACKPNDANAYPTFFDGFDLAVVLIVYASLIVLSIIIYFLKRKLGDTQGETSSSNDRGDGSEYFDSPSTTHKLLSDSANGMGSNVKINKSSIKEDSLVKA